MNAFETPASDLMEPKCRTTEFCKPLLEGWVNGCASALPGVVYFALS